MAWGKLFWTKTTQIQIFINFVMLMYNIMQNWRLKVEITQNTAEFRRKIARVLCSNIFRILDFEEGKCVSRKSLLEVERGSKLRVEAPHLQKGWW